MNMDVSHDANFVAQFAADLIYIATMNIALAISNFNKIKSYKNIHESRKQRPPQATSMRKI